MASNMQSVRVQNNADAPLNQVITASSPWSAQYDFWLTPYGFLKGAMMNPVTVGPGTLDNVKYTVISYTLQEVQSRGLPERPEHGDARQNVDR